MASFDLPAPVSAYITAFNAFDLDAMMATFADNALVNDHRNEFSGLADIRNWAKRETVGDRVTMQVTGAIQRGDSASVNAIVEGDFDKTGLPDPLILSFYFSVNEGRIVQLVIVHNKPVA